MKKCGIEPNELEDLAADRSGWRSLCKGSQFEADPFQCLEVKRVQRKCCRSTSDSRDFERDICVRQGSDCTHAAQVICDRRSVDIDGSVHVCVCECDSVSMSGYVTFGQSIAPAPSSSHVTARRAC